jgi:hypothetical protein
MLLVVKEISGMVRGASSTAHVLLLQEHGCIEAVHANRACVTDRAVLTTYRFVAFRLYLRWQGQIVVPYRSPCPGPNALRTAHGMRVWLGKDRGVV